MLVKSSKQPIVYIISLGYVGLLVATEFPRHFKVIGLDTNIKLVREPDLSHIESTSEIVSQNMN